MAPLFEAPARLFAVFLAGFEVRETLYMLRGSYVSVLSERGGQGAEILLFFAGFDASNEDVRWFCSSGWTVEAQRGRVRGRSS
jgi:hypothetical protein